MPFKVTREELSLLVNPMKNQDQLEILGGCEKLLSALCVDPAIGITSIAKTSSSAKSVQQLKESSSQVQISVMGATATEDERRKAFGENKLPPMRQNTIFDYMLAAISDKIMILLSTVSLISLGLGLYEDFGPNADPTNRIHWVEGFSILIAVVIIVIVASLNDLQKESKFRKLNSKKEDRSVKGIRNGETQLISIYDILVGDILLVEPGDVLAADGIVISCMGLKCDESSATGESDAVKKNPDRESILLSGSQVLEGMGKYVVTNVGQDSFYGKIMMGMRIEMEDTPLQVKLDGLAERIAKFGSAGAVFMFIILISKYVISVMQANGFGNGSNQENGTEVASQILKIIMQSVAVIAIAVPEGLPLAVTLALAYATTRMMRDNCLVRVISSCETMGNATTICSDKTGTLTQNRMTVVSGVVGKNVFFEGPDEVKKLVATLKSLPMDSASDANYPISNAKMKSPGLDGVALIERVAEGICANSSVFQTKNESGEAKFIGSKTETALIEWVNAMGFDFVKSRLNPNFLVIQMLPFSSERKYMATVIKISKLDCPTIYRVHVKGAAEIVLKICDRVALLPFHSSKPPQTQDMVRSSKSLSAGSLHQTEGLIPAVGSRSNPAGPLIYHFDPKLRRDCSEKIENFAQNSLRTICLAFRDFSADEFQQLVNGPLLEKFKSLTKESSLPRKPKSLNTEISAVASSLESFPLPQVIEESISQAELLAHPVAFSEVFCTNLICASIVGIEDPLRPEVEAAVKECQKAGVCVRMVTGDNPSTALSISKRCGIYQKGGIILEGQQFRKMTQQEREIVLPRLQVLARSSPADKQLLVASLKAMGEIVAVTGDGTNDGPALKMADIGFSMGIAGTEVAKEASSIILMDDSFASVVKAMLSVNFSAMLLTLVSSMLDSSESSVLTVVQLLWVNLVIDTLAALALGTEKPLPDILDRPPESRQAPLINFAMWKMILGQAILQVAVNLSLLLGGAQFFGFRNLLDAGGILSIKSDNATQQALYERGLLRTIVFNTFVLMQIFNQVNCRRITSNINIFSGIFQNPFFSCIFVLVFFIQAIIVQYGSVTFQTTPLNITHWIFCVLVGITSIPWGLVIRLLPLEIFSLKRQPELVTTSQVEKKQATIGKRTPSEVALSYTIPEKIESVLVLETNTTNTREPLTPVPLRHSISVKHPLISNSSEQIFKHGSMDGTQGDRLHPGNSQQTQVYNLLRGNSRRRSTLGAAKRTASVSHQIPSIPQRFDSRINK